MPKIEVDGEFDGAVELGEAEIGAVEPDDDPPSIPFNLPKNEVDGELAGTLELGEAGLGAIEPGAGVGCIFL